MDLAAIIREMTAKGVSDDAINRVIELAVVAKAMEERRAYMRDYARKTTRKEPADG